MSSRRDLTKLRKEVDSLRQANQTDDDAPQAWTFILEYLQSLHGQYGAWSTITDSGMVPVIADGMFMTMQADKTVSMIRHRPFNVDWKFRFQRDCKQESE